MATGTTRRAPRASRADGEATRVRILEAAGELFAEQGYADTTGKAVAARAAVDLASINYHFGSRAGLYQQVLVEGHRRWLDLADLKRLAGSAVSPEARLKKLIEYLVERAMQEQSWPSRVLAREILAPSPHLARVLQRDLQPKLGALLSLISEITGIPEGQPALLACALNVLAPCLVLLVAARGVPGPLQAVRTMPHEALSQHLQMFALAGLRQIRRNQGAVRLHARL